MTLDTGVRIAACVLAWLLGTAAQMQQAALWPDASYLGLLALALVVGLAAWRRSTLLLCLALALAAFAGTGWRAAQRLAVSLPAALEGRDLWLTGVITHMPQPGPQGTRFVFRVEQALLEDRPVSVPPRIALGWYRDVDGEALLAAPAQELRAGQRWQLAARLRQPHGTLNPHGFDLELWLFEQGIRATGSVRASAAAAPRLLAEDVGHPVERARQTVRDAILLRVPDAQAAACWRRWRWAIRRR
jgi:competence protein ComEC